MKRRLLYISIAFSFSFLVMGGLSIFSMKRMQKYITYSNMMDHSNFVLEDIYLVEKNLLDIDRKERGYMLTEDSIYLAPMRRAIDTIPLVLHHLKGLTSDNPSMASQIDSFERSFVHRLDLLRTNIEYVDTSKGTNLSNFYFDSRQMMAVSHKFLKNMLNSESVLRKERLVEEKSYEDLTRKSVMWLLVLFCVMTFMLLIILIKEILKRVQYQEELHSKVIDLERSHEELQEIALVASHDLAEPLRKIQMFGDFLLHRSDKNSEEAAHLTRIVNSAGQMQELVQDINSLTSLSDINEPKKKFNANKLWQYILFNSEKEITEKGGDVKSDALPVLFGYENQVEILFKEILNNAVKFSKGNKSLLLRVEVSKIKGSELNEINERVGLKSFYKITFSDNGVGFDAKNGEKLFKIFRQFDIEGSPNPGKGVGLAICRRIMANHNGYITATGKIDEGAVFSVYFPVGE